MDDNYFLGNYRVMRLSQRDEQQLQSEAEVPFRATAGFTCCSDAWDFMIACRNSGPYRVRSFKGADFVFRGDCSVDDFCKQCGVEPL